MYICILRYISMKLLYRSLSLLPLIKYLSTKQVSGGREDKLCRVVNYFLQNFIIFYELLLFCKVFLEVGVMYFLKTFIIFDRTLSCLLQFFTPGQIFSKEIYAASSAPYLILSCRRQRNSEHILILNRSERNI